MKEKARGQRKSTKPPQERRRYPIGVDPRKDARRERAAERLQRKENGDS